VELWILEEGRRVAACAGFERHGRTALLRSVAVIPDARGSGHGTRIVRATLERLDALGVTETYLVTLDAADFFGRLGFRPVERDSVPAAVRISPEWTLHLCAGGTWMRRAPDQSGSSPFRESSR
jgi:amino-acid N-acetyltransferase